MHAYSRLLLMLVLPVACAEQARIDSLSPGLTNANQVAIGDIDGDGLMDLVVSSSSQVRWLRNQGGGFAESAQLFSSGGGKLVLADLDGDGRLDVVTNSGQVGWGTGAEATPGPVFFGSAVAVADVDSDGMLDILRGTETAVRVWRNLGAREFETAVSLAQKSVSAIIASDFDSDGSPDLVVTSSFNSAFNSSMSAGLWLGDGRGQFTATQSGLDTVKQISPAVAFDADGDGADELAFTNDSNVVVLSGPAFATELARLDTSPGVTELALLTGTETGLVGADGQLDELQAHRASGGKMSAAQQVKLKCSPTGLAVGNLDGKGQLDWVTLDVCTDKITVAYW